MLGQSPTQDPNEQEFIMAMLKSWEEGKAEARAEGRAEARVEAQVNAVLTVLRVRGIEVPAAVRERILAEKDINRLTRWFENAIVSSTIGEVIDKSE
jgi:post-segregation antitoxin (ccd killing protein)